MVRRRGPRPDAFLAVDALDSDARAAMRVLIETDLQLHP